MILAERAARREAEAVAARAQAVNSRSDALIARLRLEIEKLKRDIHGSRSERKARLLEQMELQLEELPNGRCAASLSEGRHGSSPAPIVVLIARPSWQR
ncbi:DNA relaxase NicK [Sinorhizobium meliloti]|uniref:transposase domain-containing protein n=1 Tax=Rhizobium meliloti TaxID=382 RepID=UPI00399A2188